MAVTGAPGRQEWAAQILAVEPGDRLLEIGCGHGLAVSLVCEKLRKGKITAIDRSASMIRMASQRNAEHVDAGRAVFHAIPLEKADLPDTSFHKIYAVNVSLFWLGTDPSQIELVKRLLKPKGRLFVFNEPPTSASAKAIGDKANEVLAEHGFTTTRHTATSRKGLPLTCIEGILPG